MSEQSKILIGQRVESFERSQTLINSDRWTVESVLSHGR